MRDKHKIEEAGGPFEDPTTPCGSILAAVLKELDAGRTKFGQFASDHEGCSVIREEFEELWECVKAKADPKGQYPTDYHRLKHAQREAIQLAAVSLRFAIELELGLTQAVENQALEMADVDTENLKE